MYAPPYRKRSPPRGDFGPPSKRRRDSPHGCTVWLGNLPWEATERDIALAFQSCGEIAEVRLRRDPETGKGKGFGFLEFYDPRGGHEAVRLNGTLIQGRPVRVELTGPDGGPPPNKELGRNDPIPPLQSGFQGAHNAPYNPPAASYAPQSTSYTPGASPYAAQQASAPQAGTGFNLASLLANAQQQQQQPQQHQHMQQSTAQAGANPLLLQLLLASQNQASQQQAQPQQAQPNALALLLQAQQAQQQQRQQAAPVSPMTPQAVNPLAALGGQPLSHAPAPPVPSSLTSNTLYAEGNAPGRGRDSHTVFIGNLSDDCDEEALLRAFEHCGEVIGIRWLNDRATGRFKGCGFIEFFDVPSAQRALQSAGMLVRGKPIRCDNADDEPGGLVASGGVDIRARKLHGRDRPRYDDRMYDRGYDDRFGGRFDRGYERGRDFDRGYDRGRDYDRRGGYDEPRRSRERSRERERGRRDEGSARHITGHKTIFVGSLSDDVTEEALREKFGAVGEVRNVRWVNDRRSGMFKGCCFIEFATEDQCLRAIDLNGDNLLNRPMRVDFAEDRRDANVAPHMMAPNAGLAVTQDDLDKVIARNAERQKARAKALASATPSEVKVAPQGAVQSGQPEQSKAPEPATEQGVQAPEPAAEQGVQASGQGQHEEASEPERVVNETEETDATDDGRAQKVIVPDEPAVDEGPSDAASMSFEEPSSSQKPPTPTPPPAAALTPAILASMIARAQQQQQATAQQVPQPQAGQEQGGGQPEAGAGGESGNAA